ncbi:hypothetical protein [Fusobacterium sp. MFO224]|uniref:hypothetical protein n=1 Tax=Fusobacterium sp. MFO224 TaxID=3378070 RepID=UPI0038544912
MKITSVGEMIRKGIQKSKTLRESLLKAYWRDIVGNMEVKSEVIKIKEDQLFIKVEGSANLHFMKMKETTYLNNIEKLLNGKFIQKINFRLGKINLNNKIQKEFERMEEIEEITEIDYSNYSLEERIKMLEEMSKIREQYLLENGYKKCIQCGNLFLGKENKCPKCRGIKDRTVVNKY